MSDVSKRIGKFVISRPLLFDAIEQDITALSEVFRKVIIVKAEYLFIKDGVEYTAYCEDFREIHDAEEPPFYTVTGTISNGDKIPIIHFEELK